MHKMQYQKGNKLLEESGMVLVRKPRAPLNKIELSLNKSKNSRVDTVFLCLN